jgi:hypothetical protein
MELNQQSATLLRVVKKEGTGKSSGKPYLFYTAVILMDTEVFELNLSNDLVKNDDLLENLLEARSVPVIVDVKVSPRGKFEISATITNITLK